MSPEKRRPAMHNQSQALDAYLQDLLGEPVARAVAADGSQAVGAGSVSQIRSPGRAQAVSGSEAVDPVAPSPPPVPFRSPTRFEARLFEVAGLALAIPLAQLRAVADGCNDPVPLPASHALIAGRSDYEGGQINVIDTARLILPPQRTAGLAAQLSRRCRHLLVLAHSPWALACERVGETVTLEPADVNWRGAAGKRPWLAGTVRERLCALIDVDGLARMLTVGDV